MEGGPSPFDVELGPVMVAEEDRAADPPFEENHDVPLAEEAAVSGQIHQDPAQTEYERHSEYEHYADHAEVESPAENFSSEIYPIDSSDEVQADVSDMQAEQHCRSEIEEPFDEPASEEESESDGDGEPRLQREPHFGGLNMGEQTMISLRTVGNNGHKVNGSNSISLVPSIDVDESVEFPDLNGLVNADVDLLGWIPDNGAPVSQIQILSLVRSFGETLDLPVLLYGKLIESDAWIKINQDNFSARYTDLMLSMQLMHCEILIDEQSWWRFFNMIERIAKSLSRSFYLSLSLDSAIEKSKRVASVIQDLNIQAVLKLQSDNGQQLSGRTLEYLAREYQLDMLEAGRIFEKPDPVSSGSAPLFTLIKMESDEDGADSAQSDSGDLMLVSDLPCVSDPLDSFDQMVDFAWTLANRFPLTLVDERYQKVSAKDIQTIRSHIERFVDDMDYCRIAPGGDVAMRLFDESKSYPRKTDEPDLAEATADCR